MSFKKSQNIGVIVPLFNKVGQITRALDSILYQKSGFDEIIVVDDYSTDGSYELIVEYKKKNSSYPLKIIRHFENKGPGAARNTGLREIKSECFCFLDADDYFELDFLENIKRKICKNPIENLLVFQIRETSSNSVRPSLKRLRKFTEIISEDEYLVKDWAKAMLADSIFCSGGNVLVPKALIENIYFNESTRNFEDWDFYFKVASLAKAKNLPFRIIGSVGLVYTDDDEKSLSRSRTLSSSLLVPPVMIYDPSLSLEIKRFVVGKWLMHIAPRMSLSNFSKFIFNFFKKNKILIPKLKIILISYFSCISGLDNWIRIKERVKKKNYG